METSYFDKIIDKWKPPEGALASAEKKLAIPLKERQETSITLTPDEKMAIIQRHYGWIKKIVLRHYWKKEQWRTYRNELDDVLQEAILHLVAKLDENYNPALGGVTTYIGFLRLSLNKQLDTVHYSSLDELEATRQFPDPEAEDPLEETTRRELRALCNKLYASLPSDQEREIFELYFVKDLNGKRVAVITGCTRGKIMKIFKKNLRRCKHLIEKNQDLKRALREFL